MAVHVEIDIYESGLHDRKNFELLPQDDGSQAVVVRTEFGTLSLSLAGPAPAAVAEPQPEPAPAPAKKGAAKRLRPPRVPGGLGARVCRTATRSVTCSCLSWNAPGRAAVSCRAGTSFIGQGLG
jgi:hypothetical protein